MDIKKLKASVEVLKDDLGDGLIATDIFTVEDGMSIAGYNPQPKASALFNNLTTDLMETLRSANFPNLDKYYILDLEGDHLVIVLPLGDYRWGMLVNSKKVQLGLLLSIAIPDCIQAFEDAL